ncbi:MAG: aldehyde dehydrogenase family protein, partial [Xanthomonadales bacterium]|nr:aldehyde dehydrogenase family protein [Xanthomonadales bacterium]
MSYQKPEFKAQYENFIGGEWVAPVDGEYFDDSSPVDGNHIARVPKSNGKDIDLAVEAAGKAANAWGKTPATERSNIMFKIAERIEENLESLALVECWDNGKAIRETMAADIPLAVDHFRYFGSVIRAEAGQVADLDAATVSMEVHEPLGVVGQIIPWNFPILMATWKLAPALSA